MFFKKKRSTEQLELQKQLIEKIDSIGQRIGDIKRTEEVLNDIIPSNIVDRKRFIGDVAYFYESSFKNKILHFITLQRDQLQVFGLSEKQSDFIRATIHSFDLIDTWMNQCLLEHIADINKQKDGSDVKNLLNNLEEKYNVN